MDIIKASRDLLRIKETPLSTLSCEELKKEPIRPFSLQYLALSAVLGNNHFVEDNQNELQTNKHLFETDLYKKLLQNTAYNTTEDEHCLEFIDTVRYERVKRWFDLCTADRIYQYLLRKQKDRCCLDYKVIRPWCKCKIATFKTYCVEDTYYCTEYERLANAHYSSCDQTF